MHTQNQNMIEKDSYFVINWNVPFEIQQIHVPLNSLSNGDCKYSSGQSNDIGKNIQVVNGPCVVFKTKKYQIYGNQ